MSGPTTFHSTAAESKAQSKTVEAYCTTRQVRRCYFWLRQPSVLSCEDRKVSFSSAYRTNKPRVNDANKKNGKTRRKERLARMQLTSIIWRCFCRPKTVAWSLHSIQTFSSWMLNSKQTAPVPFRFRYPPPKGRLCLQSLHPPFLNSSPKRSTP